MRRFSPSLAFFMAIGLLVGNGAFRSWADENQVTEKGKPAKSEKEIRRWIGQLGSERFQDREQATQELSKLGPAALPKLKEAVKSPDAEVRRRAQRLVERMEPPSAQSINPLLEQQIPAAKIYL